MLAFISASEEIFTNLNGIRIKIRKDCAEIDFWLKNVDEQTVLENYRDWILKVTTLEEETSLEVIHFHTEV